LGGKRDRDFFAWRARGERKYVRIRASLDEKGVEFPFLGKLMGMEKWGGGVLVEGRGAPLVREEGKLIGREGGFDLKLAGARGFGEK